MRPPTALQQLGISLIAAGLTRLLRERALRPKKLDLGQAKIQVKPDRVELGEYIQQRYGTPSLYGYAHGGHV